MQRQNGTGPNETEGFRHTWLHEARGKGEVGRASRDKELLKMLHSAGWSEGDSPLGLQVPGAQRFDAPVLTGNAWHHGELICPAECAANSGVCYPPLGRCDCPRHRWGPVCEHLVEPAISRTTIFHGWCVYNDSSPWFCDKPLCTSSMGSFMSVSRSGRSAPTTERCVGEPVDRCPSRCNGKGTCAPNGACRCIPGYRGPMCEKQVAVYCVNNCSGRGACELGFCACRPPFFGVDCSLTPPQGGWGSAAHVKPKGWGIQGQLKIPAESRIRARSSESKHLRKSRGDSSSTDLRSAAGDIGCADPCIYVYELPARFNVLALKAEPSWPFYSHGPADYRAFKAIHVSLLRSQHRTADPRRARYFYVPTWDLHGAWGNPEVYLRAHRYIRTHFPYWNASQGKDHIWTVTRDAAACSTPWGSVWEQTKSSILLTNWGGVTGLAGVPTERCFDATRDLAIPGVLKAHIVRKSPILPFYSRYLGSTSRLVAAQRALAAPAEPKFDTGSSLAATKAPSLSGQILEALEAVAAAAVASMAPWKRRDTLLLFHGALCWQIYDKVKSMREMNRKCQSRSGFLNNYAFGVRHEVYKRHHKEPGFNLRATDLLPPPPRADLDELTLRSIFCLCPSGTGWGMRAFHAVALGCIPVIIQDDGSSHYPSVLQAFEGPILDWEQLAVRLTFNDIPQLPAILRALAGNSTNLARKRTSLVRAWSRLLWREAMSPEDRLAIDGAPDAFDSIMQSLKMRPPVRPPILARE
mmetsp:Transcript_13903/g.42397  ORF Transcript_13903/g.42397 Transcript_13903/m.42397 type:complete len:751 (-) Transcript_13903:639-2891(-)